MGGINPNWWSNMHQQSSNHDQQQASLNNSSTSSLFPSSQYVTDSSSLTLNPYADNHDHLPNSWSQLLMGGLASDEEKLCLNNFQSKNKLEIWEVPSADHDDVKQEEIICQGGVNNNNNLLYGVHGGQEDRDFDESTRGHGWPQITYVSSPRSCVTSLSNNHILDFSHNKADGLNQHQQQADHSSECYSTATTTGGVCKKARVQSSPSQPPLKVRKEKLGDRISALHQLVSPFGKTDTASVLLEVIGYIRFLQTQIEALSSPYLGNPSGNMRNQHSVQGERNCIFPEDPGQLLNDNCLKRRGAPNQDIQVGAKDLRSRGLCLVPVSCTQHVGSDNGADYWAPAFGGGF